nr:methionyl-tRNA formyltransferase [Oceanivirga miroungae]
MKTIFMGTPSFGINALDYLKENTKLVAIYTKEDKLNKRGNKVEYSPVKEYAIKNNIECIQVKSLKEESVCEKLKSFDADLIVVAAYGKIIPKNIIDLPRLGIINIHSSLLPKYRGASPIQNAILNGDKETGVTIMMIDEGLDTGDMLEKASIEISEDDNLETLTNKLAILSVKPLDIAVNKLISGTETREKQDDSLKSFVYPIKKEEALIDFSKEKEQIFNMVRAFNPKPVSYAILNNEVLKIYEVEKVDENFDAKFGEVVKLEKKGPVVKVNGGAIRLKKVQLPGKKIIGGFDLINGRKISLGDVLNA